MCLGMGCMTPLAKIGGPVDLLITPWRRRSPHLWKFEGDGEGHRAGQSFDFRSVRSHIALVQSPAMSFGHLHTQALSLGTASPTFREFGFPPASKMSTLTFRSVNVGNGTAKTWIWWVPAIVPRVTPPEHTVGPYSQRHLSWTVFGVQGKMSMLTPY